jgi:hypothetical protein
MHFVEKPPQWSNTDETFTLRLLRETSRIEICLNRESVQKRKLSATSLDDVHILLISNKS